MDEFVQITYFSAKSFWVCWEIQMEQVARNDISAEWHKISFRTRDKIIQKNWSNRLDYLWINMHKYIIQKSYSFITRITNLSYIMENAGNAAVRVQYVLVKCFGDK